MCDVDFGGFDPDVARILRNALNQDYRLRLHYGDTDTGRDWMEVYDVSGYVRNSTGTRKIPILCHNRRSLGGGGICRNIVRIRYANKNDGGDLYRHPLYHVEHDKG